MKRSTNIPRGSNPASSKSDEEQRDAPVRPSYHHFVLLLWEEVPHQPGTWRLSLQNPQTGERIGFTSTTDLASYLDHWMERKPGPDR